MYFYILKCSCNLYKVHIYYICSLSVLLCVSKFKVIIHIPQLSSTWMWHHRLNITTVWNIMLCLYKKYFMLLINIITTALSETLIHFTIRYQMYSITITSMYDSVKWKKKIQQTSTTMTLPQHHKSVLYLQIIQNSLLNNRLYKFTLLACSNPHLYLKDVLAKLQKR